MFYVILLALEIQDSAFDKITSISCNANAGLQQQHVCLFSKLRYIEGNIVAEGKVVVADVEPDLLAQVEVEEGQGWRHVLFLELGGGISSSYMSGAESKRQKWAR